MNKPMPDSIGRVRKETVVIHHILAKGTIDEDVMKALEIRTKHKLHSLMQ